MLARKNKEFETMFACSILLARTLVREMIVPSSSENMITIIQEKLILKSILLKLADA